MAYLFIIEVQKISWNFLSKIFVVFVLKDLIYDFSTFVKEFYSVFIIQQESCARFLQDDTPTYCNKAKMFTTHAEPLQKLRLHILYVLYTQHVSKILTEC